MDKTSHVYILTDRRNGTLYTGVMNRAGFAGGCLI
jgi:predicted GIY-YIG superfamily endonuclease